MVYHIMVATSLWCAVTRIGGKPFLVQGRVPLRRLVDVGKCRKDLVGNGKTRQMATN